MTETIRAARPGDEAELTAMVHELADFEHAASECTVTETQLGSALFGPQPTVHAHLVEVDGQAAAAALWFLNFSTWDGRVVMHGTHGGKFTGKHNVMPINHMPAVSGWG